ncbi:ATP12 family chaperone protein [Thalassospira sp.]|uniref:ATP12 family chaperone protein n=1 Tax=Thalassospira sp. TaxID=1912094 RepID=UPI002735CDE4|nr:ATP12 family protein [Thalassospira sp.]MDP2698484.1 ATP12 family protein [Thalassospira sp.]
MQTQNLKRFYQKAEAVRDDLAPGWRIHLDGRAVKSPGRADFVLTSEALARAIAAEWDGQGDHIVPSSMPMMQLAATVIDRVVPNRMAVIGDLTGYGRSDLLCYRADFPEELVTRQAKAWQPLLDWAARELDVALKVTQGVMPVAQDDAALLHLQDAIESLDDNELTALHTVTTISGSVIIGLAMLRGFITPAEVFDIAQIDDSYSMERWGEDAEAMERRQRQKAEFLAAGRFLELLRG